MKYIIAVLTISLAAVSCQSPSRPPPPPGTQGQTSTQQTRPKGCSPGCGPTEICAELGASYCKSSSSCSVCIKMSSIRFPASALAGMFSQQQKQQQQQQQLQQQQQQQQALVAAQQMPMHQPAFGTEREQISLLELASHQQKIQQKLSSTANDNNRRTLPPRPPPANADMVVRPVNEIAPLVHTLGDSSNTQDPFAKTTPGAKYPIVATVHDPTANIHEAPIILDRGQLDQIHQQYEQGNVAPDMSSSSTEQKPTRFDFESFKRYQAWMKQQQLPAEMSMAEEYAQFQKYTEFVKQQEKEKQLSQNLNAVSTQNFEPSPTMESPNNSSTLPPFDFAAFKSQFGNGVAPAAAATDAINSPSVQPPSGPEAQYYDYATLQRMWQQQQQQLNQVYQVAPNTQNVHNAQNVQNVHATQNTAITYDPQPPVDTYHDPFDIFGFNDPLFGNPVQQTNMFDLMLLDGMGMGMGLGFGF